MPSFFTLLSLATAAAAFALPGPIGPYAVGYSTAVLTDNSRQDPYASTPQKRRVLLSAYLPVDVSKKPCPKQTLPYMTPAVAAHYGESAAQLGLANDTFAKFEMQFCDLRKLCAKKTRGAFPVVLYDTGLGTSRALYGVKARNLASQGYVVVTVDHPYDTDIVEFTDGSVVESVPFNGTEPEIVKFQNVRVQDLSFVLAQLQTPSVRRSILTHYPSGLDFSRAAAVGHSLGGVASALLASQQPLVRAGINMDGGIHEPLLSGGSSAPTMQFGRAGHGETDPSWDEFWPRLRGPAAELALANATHGTFTDLLTLAEPLFTKLPADVVAGLKEMYGSIEPQEAERTIVGGMLAGLEFAFEGNVEAVERIHDHFPSLAVVRSHL